MTEKKSSGRGQRELRPIRRADAEVGRFDQQTERQPAIGGPPKVSAAAAASRLAAGDDQRRQIIGKTDLGPANNQSCLWGNALQ